ncbi:hypothetical protein TRAPUB_4962 [Trametes pubescens]|uniref:Uncharacterized protein n=1 Tax=Trametes pubescens TaxID=154538 RepID=A0A1M2V9L7_TRAPU|nr:hypothetical protein TRAPUB_4962 [Trametes pubescens]
MAVDIELEDLSKSTTRTQPDHTSETAPLPDTNFPAVDDGVIHAWAWASAVLLVVLAVPLILSPRLLLFLSETGTERRAALTPLESFMAFHTGILVFAIALALIFNIPLDPLDVSANRGAPGHPLLGSLSVACVLISFISYNTKSVGPLGFLVFLGSGTIGLWGLWALLFSGSAYVSRKTGADKRTSRFLFGNKAAASVQKKQWKKGRST